MSEYTLTVFGMNIVGKSPIIYALVPVLLVVAYLISCASLYSFAQMFGIVEFSWMNGIYWMIVVSTIGWIFNNATK